MAIKSKKFIYIIAGEASGDLLGANLIKGLKPYFNDIEWKGVGGELMEKQGISSLFPLNDISHMGLIEILKHFPLIWRRFWQTVQDIKQSPPCLLITIDSPEFTLRVAKEVRKLKIPHLHYVAPTVWAWRSGRAKQLAKKIDHLLTLYDFEPPYFLRENLPTTFVGHPLAVQLENFSKNRKLDYLALLPGSRFSEITTLLPVFLEMIPFLQKKFKFLNYWLPTLDHCVPLVKKIIQQYHLADVINVITNREEKYRYFQSSIGALAASGTATLELGLMGIPTLITYKVHPITAFLGRFLIKTPFIGLPNIILGQPIMPELIQEKCCVSEILPKIEKIIEEKSQQDFFNEKRQLLLNHLKTKGKPEAIIAKIVNSLISC